MSSSARNLDRAKMSSKQLILKILSGAYSGAELLLENSQYILGSAVDSDISIEDASLAPTHFKIELVQNDSADPSILVDVLSGILPVYHNNRKVEGASFELRPCDRVQVGDFIFGIGPEEGLWTPYEQVLERDKQEEQAAKAVAEESKVDGEAEEGESVSEGGEQVDEINSEEEQAVHAVQHEDVTETEGDSVVNGSTATATENSGDKRTGGSKNGALAVIMGSFLGLVILMAVAIVLYPMDDAGSYSPAAPDSPVPQSPMSNNPMSRDGYPVGSSGGFSQDQTYGNNPQYFTTANKQTESVGKNIIDSVEGKWIPNQQEQQVLQRAVESIKSMFVAFKFTDLQVEYGSEPLTLVIKGYTNRVAEWRKVNALINRDVGDIKQILDLVETPWTRKKQLEQMLADSGLEEETQVYMTEKGLLVKTSLSYREEVKWTHIEEDYHRLYENNPPLFRVKDTAPWLEIKSVNFGYEPFLVTADGTKYLVGSHIKNGYILDKITPEGIVLKNDGLIKNLPLP